jgi:hypothetical protein
MYFMLLMMMMMMGTGCMGRLLGVWRTSAEMIKLLS